MTLGQNRRKGWGMPDYAPICWAKTRACCIPTKTDGGVVTIQSTNFLYNRRRKKATCRALSENPKLPRGKPMCEPRSGPGPTIRGDGDSLGGTAERSSRAKHQNRGLLNSDDAGENPPRNATTKKQVTRDRTKQARGDGVSGGKHTMGVEGEKKNLPLERKNYQAPWWGEGYKRFYSEIPRAIDYSPPARRNRKFL